MDAKQAFEAQILDDLPEGIRNFLAVPIPALVGTSAPSDVDTAIIAQGTLAHNLNTILKAFEGLTPAAVPMYLAQLNTVSAGMLAAALEFVGGSGDIKIVAPLHGGLYTGHFGIDTLYEVIVLRGTAQGVTASIVNGDKFDMIEDTEQPGRFTAEWPTPLGDHVVTFVVQWEDNSTTREQAAFTVAAYPTYPAEGDIVPEGQFTFYVDVCGDLGVESMGVCLRHEDTGEEITVPLVEKEGRFEALVDLIKLGPYVAAVTIALMVRQIEQEIKFVYGSEPLTS